MEQESQQISEFKKKKIDHYIAIKEIGQGTFGKVYEVRDEQDPKEQIKAMKMIKKSNHNLERIQEEIMILKKCKSPNVLKFHDVRQTTDNIYIITEFCEKGDLKKYIKNHEKQKLSEKEAIYIFQQLLCGFNELHKLRKKGQIIGAIHRDIKPENILLDNNLVVKISDMGSAKICHVTHSVNIGTPYYMSPEMISKLPYNSKIDIWALGLVLYEMVVGTTLFEDIEEEYHQQNYEKQKKIIFDNILDEEYIKKKLNCLENEISIEYKNLIFKMLRKDPKKRIDWKDLHMHSIFGKKKILESINNKNDLILLEKSNNSSDVELISSIKFYQSELIDQHNDPNYDLYNNAVIENEINNPYRQPCSENQCSISNYKPDLKKIHFEDSEENNDHTMDFKYIEIGFLSEKEILNKQNELKKEEEKKISRVKKLYFYILKLIEHMVKIIEDGFKMTEYFAFNYGFVIFLKKLELILLSLQQKQNLYQFPYFNDLLQSTFSDEFFKLIDTFLKTIQTNVEYNIGVIKQEAKNEFEKNSIIFIVLKMLSENLSSLEFDKYFKILMNNYIKDWEHEIREINIINKINDKKLPYVSLLNLFHCLNLRDNFEFDEKLDSGFDFENYKTILKNQKIEILSKKLQYIKDIHIKFEKEDNKMLNMSFSFDYLK